MCDVSTRARPNDMFATSPSVRAIAPRARVGAARRATARARVLSTSARAARDDGDAVAREREATRRQTLATLVSAACVATIGRTTEARADEGEGAIEGGDAIEAPTPAPKAPRALSTKRVQSESLAYEFSYAVEAESGKPINWAVSRERDTYSSAEPMSPNARQRIVYELLSFKGPLTTVVTVSNTPPTLESKPVKEWTAKRVANAVLADKATGRVASGQRVSLAEVDNARTEIIDGTPYHYYEYISQGSPNLREPEATTFRHSYGVTVERDGYLYTLSSSAPEIYWDELSRGFDDTIKSFRLTTPNKKKYRQPGNEGLGISLPF